MPGIPAASIHDVDIELIRSRAPEAAHEIERIGQLMLSGRESDDEFMKLCKLLLDVGYARKSEQLLRANASASGAERDLYIELFGTRAEEDFQRAVQCFSQQFGVRLVRTGSQKYLHDLFECQPEGLSDQVSDRLRSLFLGTPEVQIAYCNENDIVADIFARCDASTPVVDAQPLSFEHGNWVPVQNLKPPRDALIQDSKSQCGDE